MPLFVVTLTREIVVNAKDEASAQKLALEADDLYDPVTDAQVLVVELPDDVKVPGTKLYFQCASKWPLIKETDNEDDKP